MMPILIGTARRASAGAIGPSTSMALPSGVMTPAYWSGGIARYSFFTSMDSHWVHRKEIGSSKARQWAMRAP